MISTQLFPLSQSLNFQGHLDQRGVATYSCTKFSAMIIKFTIKKKQHGNDCFYKTNSDPRIKN